MTIENPSIMSHVSIGTNDFDRAVAFYDELLASLGCIKIMDFPGAVAYGKQFPEFWVQTPLNGAKASVGNGTHFCFLATSNQQVDAFYQAALKLGARDDGKPGPRPEYSEAYYGCFVLDIDGHKIEASYWDEAKAPV